MEAQILNPLSRASYPMKIVSFDVSFRNLNKRKFAYAYEEWKKGMQNGALYVKFSIKNEKSIQVVDEPPKKGLKLVSSVFRLKRETLSVAFLKILAFQMYPCS